MPLLAMVTEHSEHGSLEESAILDAIRDPVLLVLPQRVDELVIGVGLQVSASYPALESPKPAREVLIEVAIGPAGRQLALIQGAGVFRANNRAVPDRRSRLSYFWRCGGFIAVLGLCPRVGNASSHG